MTDHRLQGHIPIDLSTIDLDVLAFTGHKDIFGMPGIGGFCIRNPEEVVPSRMTGTGTDSGSPDQPGDLPERYEIGTRNYPGDAALTTGMGFICRTGIETIKEKTDRQVSV